MINADVAFLDYLMFSSQIQKSVTQTLNTHSRRHPLQGNASFDVDIDNSLYQLGRLGAVPKGTRKSHEYLDKLSEDISLDIDDDENVNEAESTRKEGTNKGDEKKKGKNPFHSVKKGQLFQLRQKSRDATNILGGLSDQSQASHVDEDDGEKTFTGTESTDSLSGDPKTNVEIKVINMDKKKSGKINKDKFRMFGNLSVDKTPNQLQKKKGGSDGADVGLIGWMQGKEQEATLGKPSEIKAEDEKVKDNKAKEKREKTERRNASSNQSTPKSPITKDVQCTGLTLVGLTETVVESMGEVNENRIEVVEIIATETPLDFSDSFDSFEEKREKVTRKSSVKEETNKSMEGIEVSYSTTTTSPSDDKGDDKKTRKRKDLSKNGEILAKKSVIQKNKENKTELNSPKDISMLRDTNINTDEQLDQSTPFVLKMNLANNNNVKLAIPLQGEEEKENAAVSSMVVGGKAEVETTNRNKIKVEPFTLKKKQMTNKKENVSRSTTNTTKKDSSGDNKEVLNTSSALNLNIGERIQDDVIVPTFVADKSPTVLKKLKSKPFSLSATKMKRIDDDVIIPKSVTSNETYEIAESLKKLQAKPFSLKTKISTGFNLKENVSINPQSQVGTEASLQDKYGVSAPEGEGTQRTSLTKYGVSSPENDGTQRTSPTKSDVSSPEDDGTQRTSPTKPMWKTFKRPDRKKDENDVEIVDTAEDIKKKFKERRGSLNIETSMKDSEGSADGPTKDNSKRVPKLERSQSVFTRSDSLESLKMDIDYQIEQRTWKNQTETASKNKLNKMLVKTKKAWKSYDAEPGQLDYDKYYKMKRHKEMVREKRRQKSMETNPLDIDKYNGIEKPDESQENLDKALRERDRKAEEMKEKRIKEKLEREETKQKDVDVTRRESLGNEVNEQTNIPLPHEHKEHVKDQHVPAKPEQSSNNLNTPEMTSLESVTVSDRNDKNTTKKIGDDIKTLPSKTEKIDTPKNHEPQKKEFVEKKETVVGKKERNDMGPEKLPTIQNDEKGVRLPAEIKGGDKYVDIAQIDKSHSINKLPKTSEIKETILAVQEGNDKSPDKTGNKTIIKENENVSERDMEKKESVSKVKMPIKVENKIVESEVKDEPLVKRAEKNKLPEKESAIEKVEVEKSPERSEAKREPTIPKKGIENKDLGINQSEVELLPENTGPVVNEIKVADKQTEEIKQNKKLVVNKNKLFEAFDAKKTKVNKKPIFELKKKTDKFNEKTKVPLIGKEKKVDKQPEKVQPDKEPIVEKSEKIDKPPGTANEKVEKIKLDKEQIVEKSEKVVKLPEETKESKNEKLPDKKQILPTTDKREDKVPLPEKTKESKEPSRNIIKTTEVKMKAGSQVDIPTKNSKPVTEDNLECADEDETRRKFFRVRGNPKSKSELTEQIKNADEKDPAEIGMVDDTFGKVCSRIGDATPDYINATNETWKLLASGDQTINKETDAKLRNHEKSKDEGAWILVARGGKRDSLSTPNDVKLTKNEEMWVSVAQGSELYYKWEKNFEKLSKWSERRDPKEEPRYLWDIDNMPIQTKEFIHFDRKQKEPFENRKILK